MQLDTTINLGDIFMVLTLIVSLVTMFAKLKHDIEKKAESEDITRVEHDYKQASANLQSELKLMSAKIDNINFKLDDLKRDIARHEENYNKLEKEILIIKTEHERNHK
jgi:peptidoglycan hydrolase CwlO-like protein